MVNKGKLKTPMFNVNTSIQQAARLHWLYVNKTAKRGGQRGQIERVRGWEDGKEGEREGWRDGRKRRNAYMFLSFDPLVSLLNSLQVLKMQLHQSINLERE